MNKDDFFKEIKYNIENFGYHLTIVLSDTDPRYAYTIGLYDTLGYELILAGSVFYVKSDLILIFDHIVRTLKYKSNISQNFNIDTLGEFTLSPVDFSWIKLTMLGVFDYFKCTYVNAYQIRPDKQHFTLDIPDMSKQWEENEQPIWKWLGSKWNLSIPKDSTVITNLKAMMGETVTEIMRWEENEWEMFAGVSDSIERKDVRVLPIGTLLGLDNSLHLAIKLKVNTGLKRKDLNSEWNNWC